MTDAEGVTAGGDAEAAGVGVAVTDAKGVTDAAVEAAGAGVVEQPESRLRLMPAAPTIAAGPRPIPFMSRLSQKTRLKWPPWSMGRA